jgi:hypothetical protein
MVATRLIRTIAGIVAAILVAAVLLRVLSANPHNVIVSDLHDAGSTLVGPFKGLFSVHSAKVTMAVNWCIAAVVYLLLGHLVAKVVAYALPRRGWVRRVA